MWNEIVKETLLRHCDVTFFRDILVILYFENCIKSIIKRFFCIVGFDWSHRSATKSIGNSREETSRFGGLFGRPFDESHGQSSWFASKRFNYDCCIETNSIYQVSLKKARHFSNPSFFPLRALLVSGFGLHKKYLNSHKWSEESLPIAVFVIFLGL